MRKWTIPMWRIDRGWCHLQRRMLERNRHIMCSCIMELGNSAYRWGSVRIYPGNKNTANWILSSILLMDVPQKRSPAIIKHWKIMCLPASSNTFTAVLTLFDLSCSPRCSRQFRLPELRPFSSLSVGFLATIISTNSISALFTKYFFRTSVECFCLFSRINWMVFNRFSSVTCLEFCARFCFT